MQVGTACCARALSFMKMANMLISIALHYGYRSRMQDPQTLVGFSFVGTTDWAPT